MTKAKIATDIPAAITMPDRVETRLGTLRFTDGFPDDATVEKVFDNLDFQHAVQAFLTSMPAASLAAIRKAARDFGPDNQTVTIFESLMDSRSLYLTANTESIYAMAWLDLKNGPIVVESPPNTLGLVDDFWFRYVTDLGIAGPDKGKGGKFLFLPPDFTGTPPEGYHTFKSRTFNNWFGTRGFQVNGDPKPGVDAIKQQLRIYPLADAANPPATNFVNVSGKAFNTIHAMDASFFEEVNEVIQEEPADAIDPETLGLLASIGIEKGTPFAPDARMKKILAEAAAVGQATVRALAYRCRVKEAFFYPDSAWNTPFIGGSHEFLHQGARLLDARSYFFFYATGITPAMAIQKVGAGSAYAAAFVDAQQRPLDGGKTYKLHLPARHPGQAVLVAGALRHPDALDAADRPAVPQHRQPEERRGDQPRHVRRRLLRADGAVRQGKQLGADVARQGVDRHSSSLRSAAAVLRQDVATQRD